MHALFLMVLKYFIWVFCGFINICKLLWDLWIKLLENYLSCTRAGKKVDTTCNIHSLFLIIIQMQCLKYHNKKDLPNRSLPTNSSSTSSLQSLHEEQFLTIYAYVHISCSIMKTEPSRSCRVVTHFLQSVWRR